MPLDKSGLSTALKNVFQSAKDNSWSSDQVADALANAIDTYVRTGDVAQVTVQVKNANNQVIGTGQQTGVGKIQ